MAIPTYDQMLRPILDLATREAVTRRSATAAMSAHFGLSPEEQAARIPSGSSTYVANRAGWAMTFLTKGGLIEKVAPKQYRATASGHEFLKRHPKTITIPDLHAIPGWHDAWGTKKRRGSAEDEEPTVPQDQTPAEAIDSAIESLESELRSQLLEAVLNQSPRFFEQLVLDVLIAMGYGGSRTEAAQHLGKSGDEGIDGRISQDPLGLDQVLVQAKRFAPGQVVDRKTIQAFIGSLAGQGVTKGVFITTSSFAESAKEFVLRGSNTKVVLIDGEHLLSLMLRHHIGVRVQRQIEILDLDQNYFEESD